MTRPVTFVLNGGPGNASAWLQMGAVGPWRIELVANASASPALIPNTDTWLDDTDLVFIDRVGTGYIAASSTPPTTSVNSSGMSAPLTEAVLSVYDRLHWHPEGALYQLANSEAFRQWQYGTGFFRPQSIVSLRNALALNPGLHVIIAHGLFDRVCPYFGSQLLVNQIATGAGADRVKLLTYPGDQMFYSRDGSRTALHEQAVQLISTPLNSAAPQ